MINLTFFDLAKKSAEIAGEPIKAEWIYVQWVHETDDFRSALADEYHNLGGLTQTTPNDTPQPDGNCYYMQFDSFEDYADYFGRYLRYYADVGINEAQTLADYITSLKDGGYFGDSLENYLSDCERIYEQEFSD